MSLSRTLTALTIAACGVAATIASPALAAKPTTHFSSCPAFSLVATVDDTTFSMCFSTLVDATGEGHARFAGHLVEGSAPPARATTLTGFPCLSSYPASMEFAAMSRIVVTPSGRVTGTCRG